jgi:hypothetical protein
MIVSLLYLCKQTRSGKIKKFFKNAVTLWLIKRPTSEP